MSKITVLDNASATLWYHADRKIIHHRMHKFVYGEDLRALLMAGTELVRKHGAAKWLSDDSCSPVVSRQDEEWANTVFVPAAIAAGWKYWAIVPPKKVLGQIGMERLSKELAAKGLEVRIFEDADQAMAWLEKL